MYAKQHVRIARRFKLLYLHNVMPGLLELHGLYIIHMQEENKSPRSQNG